MAVDAGFFTAVQQAIVSTVLGTGQVESANGNQAASPAVAGVQADVWVEDLGPLPEESGLASTSGLLVFNVRLYTSAAQEPRDAVDPQLLLAASGVIGAFNAGFTLGGLVRNVDVMGAHGVRLAGKAGYMTLDNHLLRVVTVSVPLVVNDMWDQEA